MVLIPRYEWNQFCRWGVSCRTAGVLLEHRLLAPTAEFVRRVEHYGPDTETGESTIRTRTELCPAPTLSTCPVDDSAPDDAIPLAEIEDLERTPTEDPTEFRVLSVLSALRTLPPRYRIQ